MRGSPKRPKKSTVTAFAVVVELSLVFVEKYLWRVGLSIFHMLELPQFGRLSSCRAEGRHVEGSETNVARCKECRFVKGDSGGRHCIHEERTAILLMLGPFRTAAAASRLRRLCIIQQEEEILLAALAPSDTIFME